MMPARQLLNKINGTSQENKKCRSQKIMITPSSFKPGQVTYDSLNEIDPNKNLSQQLEKLNEDLLQVSYPKKITLDVGWYPSMDEKGFLIIKIIKNYNWNKPILEEECKTLQQLSLTLTKFHEYVVKILLENRTNWEQIITEKDFHPGKVKRNLLNFLEPNIQLKDQLTELVEGLLDIKYPNGATLRVGWFPGGNIKGKFRVTIRSPIYGLKRKECGTIAKLLRILQEFHQYIVNTFLNPEQSKTIFNHRKDLEVQ